MVPLCWNCYDNHDAIECETLKKLQLPDTFLIDNFDVVTPLRVLLLFYRYAEQNTMKIVDTNLKSQIDEMMCLESHCAQRYGTWIWNEHAKNVIQPLRSINIDAKFQSLNAPWTLTDDILQKICGIFDVNTFEVRTKHFEVCWRQNFRIQDFIFLYILKFCLSSASLDIEILSLQIFFGFLLIYFRSIPFVDYLRKQHS